ncbi:MAG: hypothetical protein GX567_15845 [Clostridia bacterium]|nr:hypothetical protein [Clostridia bacterium]
MKKFIGLILSLTFVLALVGCNKNSMNYIIENKPSVTGVVEEVHTDYVIMYSETAEGYPNGSRWKVSLEPENKDSYTNLVVGDEIVIYYDGSAMETDPLQIGTLYAITLKTPASREVNNETDNISTLAVANGPYGSIQLSIPDTWEFEIYDVDNEKLLSSSYGIHLKPTAETDGYIEIGYTDNFGVCGTGLETKSVTVANNEASIGYYDGNTNWAFIHWVVPDGGLKNITVLCNADWGEEYLEELLEILDTIQFNEENQTGGIGIHKVSSELGIDDGYLNASVRNVSSTSVTLVLNYSIFGGDEVGTQEELCFGSYLPISKKVGEDWVELEYKTEGDAAFEDIAYIIKENEETTYNYDWEWLYGSLEAGEYQIAIQLNSEAWIYAYFILR